MYKKIIKDIGKTRKKNNTNWMKLLEISFKYAPKESKRILRDINKQDRKINKLVDFPLDNFDMSKYVIGYSRDKYKYELYGIINHMGGCTGGHYISYIKNTDNNWYNYDDEAVKTLQLEKVVTRNAYCLFYRIKESD